MKPLGEALQNIAVTSTALEKNSLISGDGSATKAGSAITPYLPPRRPSQDEVPDILSKLRSVRLWQIKPDDQKGVKNALKVLGWTTIKATYDEAAYWIGRMLAHFPSREVTKDGVIISDLAGSCVEKGVSLVAICAICDQTWQGATRENPWLPPTGEILKEMVERTQMYEDQFQRLANPRPALPPPPKPEPKPDPYGGRKWPAFTDEDKGRFFAEIRPMWPQLQGIFRRLFEVPDDVQIPEQPEGVKDHDTEPNPETPAQIEA